MKEFFKSRMAKFCLVEVIIAVIAISAYLYYQEYKRQHDLGFEPFAITANGLTLNTIETAAVMEGTPEPELMIASSEGSKIFAKGGLNYVVANTGPDELYYSLCSTKIIEGKVNVIEGFNPKQDKLKIFCAHHEIKPEAISIIHSKFNNLPITYVKVKGQHTDTAIALLGNVDLKAEDVILNERWKIED